jgi:hypothetical protein
MNTARKGTETDREVVGIGGLSPKTQNGPIVLSDPRVGRSRDYVQAVFAGGIQVSWEANMDELYGFIRRHLNSLGQAANETLNVEGASLFNRSDVDDANEILGFDGLALLHDTHTNLDGSDTLTYKDNRLQQDLSDSSLQTGLIQFQKIQDASDNRMNVGPAQKLVYAPDNMFLIQEMLRSEGKPFSGDRGINVLRGIIQPVMLNYATDQDRWLLLAMNHDLNFFIRVAPVVDSYEDKTTKSMVHTVATRFTLGFGDFRGVVGSPGV